ncbi:MAG: uroporphyrinogen decarboxylase family protein [Bacillota bacterium]
MELRDYVISQIEHRETDVIPYTFDYTEEVAQKLNEYYGGEDWQDRITEFLNFPVTVDTLQEKDIDDKRRKDAFGGIWRVDRRPWHLETPPLAERDLEKMDFPPVSKFVNPVLRDKEEAKINMEKNKNKFQVINMGWGLFEQTWRIRGFQNILLDVIEAPDFYRELIEKIADYYVEMVRACKDIPADAFFFGDDWGDQRGVIIGPERWRQLIKPYWKKVYAEVHSQGKYVMSHSCGSVADIIPDVIEIGLDVLESVQPEAENMNPYELKKNWGEEITFWGALGTQKLIPFGSPEEIKTEIKKLKKEMGKNGGYILSSSKPLQPETPVENAVAVLEGFIEDSLR